MIHHCVTSSDEKENLSIKDNETKWSRNNRFSRKYFYEFTVVFTSRQFGSLNCEYLYLVILKNNAKKSRRSPKNVLAETWK